MKRDVQAIYSDWTRCPHCAARINLEAIRIFVRSGSPHAQCRRCGTSVCVSIVYRRSVWIITLALAWSIPYFVGLGHYVLIAWIPFFCWHVPWFRMSPKLSYHPVWKISHRPNDGLC